jgi:hypothetical protein
VKNLRKIGLFEICFLSIYIGTSIDRFLIRTRVKYPEILKGNGPLLNLIMTLITVFVYFNHDFSYRQL